MNIAKFLLVSTMFYCVLYTVSPFEDSKGVLSMRRLLPSTNNFFVFPGDVIKAACVVTNPNGISSVTWQYHVRSLSINKDLKNTTTTKIVNTREANDTSVTSVLETSDIPEAETSFYRCIANYKDGTHSKRLLQYDLIIDISLPKVDVSESEVSGKKVDVHKVIEGVYNSSVKLKCKLTFQENNHLYGQRVDVDLLVNDRTVASEHSLFYENGQSFQMVHNISGVQEDDGGMYTCRSKMKIGERTFTSSKFFNLRFPLQLTGPAEVRITCFVRQSIEMVCEIRGYPTPKWSFFYANHIVQNMTNVTVVENRLEIDDVTAEHAGMYSCVGEQQDSRNMKTQNISLIVLGVTGGDGNVKDNGNEKCGTVTQHSQNLLLYLTVVSYLCFIVAGL